MINTNIYLFFIYIFYFYLWLHFYCFYFYINYIIWSILFKYIHSGSQSCVYPDSISHHLTWGQTCSYLHDKSPSHVGKLHQSRDLSHVEYWLVFGLACRNLQRRENINRIWTDTPCVAGSDTRSSCLKTAEEEFFPPEFMSKWQFLAFASPSLNISIFIMTHDNKWFQ